MQRFSFKRLNKLIYAASFSSRVKPLKFLLSPVKTSVDESKLPPKTNIDNATIEYLKSISLVNFDSKKAIKIVEDSIRFADRIFEVDTSKVKPMVTVLEDESLWMREDNIKTDVTRSELLSLASESIENYYIAPAANTKLVSKKKFEEKSNLKDIAIKEEKISQN